MDGRPHRNSWHGWHGYQYGGWLVVGGQCQIWPPATLVAYSTVSTQSQVEHLQALQLEPVGTNMLKFLKVYQCHHKNEKLSLVCEQCYRACNLSRLMESYPTAPFVLSLTNEPKKRLCNFQRSKNFTRAAA